jgi:biotin carboxyl carrier protein
LRSQLFNRIGVFAERRNFSRSGRQRKPRLQRRKKKAPPIPKVGLFLSLRAALNRTSGEADAGGATVISSMSASIWKIRVQIGDTIRSAEDVVVILEAMKTEVNVEAGEENVGKKVKALGKGIREGAVVNAGNILVIFE